MALAYVRGWLILRWKGYPSAACWPRLIASLFGWGIVAVALLSPLDALAQLRLSMHMIQHELLMVVAPPLLLLGRPLAVALWGLPAGARSWAAQSLRRRAPLRRAFDRLTSPLVAWGVSTAVLWAWHIPAAYDAVEANGLLHDAQHVCFFASGLLFWWPIIGAPPLARRMSLPLCAGYLIAGMTQRSLLGGLIMLSNRVLYAQYAAVPGTDPSSALGDQHLAGAIMCFGSGIATLAIALVAIWRWPEEPSGSPLAAVRRNFSAKRSAPP